MAFAKHVTVNGSTPVIRIRQHLVAAVNYSAGGATKLLSYSSAGDPNWENTLTQGTGFRSHRLPFIVLDTVYVSIHPSQGASKSHFLL